MAEIVVSARASRVEGVWLAIGALTVLRIAGLAASPVDLHGDEAQYWSWSRELAFGYYSKPPLVAWAAALTTSIFGDSEWAIRLGSPIAHTIAAAFLMATARRRWGERAAAWTGLIYVTMPAVWLSSAVLSTDAYLLAAWSGALWAYDRYLDRQSLKRALALGALIGLGFLAKYAMIYFVIGLASLALLHAPSRRALRKPASLAGAAAAALCIAPNVIWNATNNFATISHTAANANWGAENFQLDELIQFSVDQLGVFGPIPFVLLLWALVGAARMPLKERERWLPLAAFAAPPLLIVAAQAFASRANANWAVSSYAAGTILVVAWALSGRTLRLAIGGRALTVRTSERWLAAALAMHLAVGAAFATAGVSPAFADRVGLANAFKRARGWEETAAIVRAAYEKGDPGGEPYVAVLADNRLLFHDLEYYTRHDPLPLRMWLSLASPRSHAEATAPMTAVDGPVLVVSERRDDETRLRADFTYSSPGEETVIDLGGGKQRRLVLFSARGFAPEERDAAYIARWSRPES